MTRRAATGLLLFSVLGLATSLTSSSVHYQLLKQPSLVTFCDVNETISCTQVYQSAYSTISGIPVAVIGAIWFALVLVLVATAWRGGPVSDNVAGYVFASSTVGLALTVYLAYASWVVLKAVCLMCVGTYVAVVGIFFISASAVQFPMRTLPTRIRGDLMRLMKSPAALLIAIVFLVAAGTALAFFPREASSSIDSRADSASDQTVQASQFERWYANEQRKTVPVPRAGAKVLVVKFNDYQCPPCRQTFETYQPILAKYRSEHPGAVRYLTLDFPLDPECNVAAPRGGHFAACEAAVAVRLAKRRNKGDDLEAWLFSNQGSLTPETVRGAARNVAGIEDFEKMYQPTLAEVRADIEIARQLGVSSTPTFFINGVMVLGGLSAPFFDAALAWEIQNAK